MMNSLSCLRRMRVPCSSLLKHVNRNPLIHPTAADASICGNSLWYQRRRGYAFKSDLKIKWVRPTKIPSYKPEKSGDCELFPQLDMTRLPAAFQKSKELETADDTVKKLFSLEFLPKKWTRREYEHMLTERVKRHEYDYTTVEVQISRMTAHIRFLQHHVDQIPKDVRSKVIVKELIEKRKKYLKFLRKWDYKRFEWLLDKLNIIFRPHPKFYHRITRKESLTKLTRRHCLSIRQERILAFKRHLESQKEAFLQEKAKSLEWIRNEEIACDVEPSVSDKDIAEVQKKLEELKLKKEKPVAEETKIPYHPECLGL
ncbi:28S ribosomal protein S15, mitochondrial [Ischnura elegans]|uniref:28S ribosomal protein S15, mitochondrial n=1 Tax=Ischnura elegans TaxID=197161 RepID=UPI001ED89A9E|nr:28S ribosomal protein S15, mitochondrial [Ischnura elegans]